MADRNLSTDNLEVAMVMAAVELTRLMSSSLHNERDTATAYTTMYNAIYEAFTQRDSSTK